MKKMEKMENGKETCFLSVLHFFQHVCPAKLTTGPPA